MQTQTNSAKDSHTNATIKRKMNPIQQGVRAASGSYREKEQRGGGVETKERNKGFGEYQGKKSGWCGVLGRQEQRTKQGSTVSARQTWLDLGYQNKG